eukprot:2439734-Ditylum_brightwellii.AAC.1
MEKWPAPPTDITKFWNEENNINKEKETATAPKYKLMVGERMYRNGGGKVEATTFKVICKDKDGLYLKSLMSATWQHEDKPRGVFVPSRTNLVTSPATYKQLLRNHNMYIQNTLAVTVEGLHPKVVDKDITVGGVKVSVRE